MQTARPFRPSPPRLLQSAGFRFALLFMGIFSVAAAFLVAVLWWATAGALDRQTVAAIRADATALVDRHRDAGTPGLIESIEDRLAQNATFFKCHRSYQVNLRNIDHFNRTEIVMRSGACIPLARSCKQGFQDAYFAVRFEGGRR